MKYVIKTREILFDCYLTISILRKKASGRFWFLQQGVKLALTDSTDPSGYLKDMRKRDEQLHKGW